MPGNGNFQQTSRRALRAVWPLLFGFYASLARADDRALILSGGGDPDLYRDRYETISKKAYETYQKLGIPTQVIAKDGTWKFAKPGDLSPATDKNAVLERIKANLRALKPGDALHLFVNDHGWRDPIAFRRADMETTGIILYADSAGKEPIVITHRELHDAIREAKPEGAFVKTVGIHCHSGGLNEIGADLPGVCGSSSTGDETTTESTHEVNLYGDAFFANLAAQPGKSLAGYHDAGSENDVLNRGRGQLSSYAYLERLVPELERDPEAFQLEEDVMALLNHGGPEKVAHGTFGKLNEGLRRKRDRESAAKAKASICVECEKAAATAGSSLVGGAARVAASVRMLAAEGEDSKSFRGEIDSRYEAIAAFLRRHSKRIRTQIDEVRKKSGAIRRDANASLGLKAWIKKADEEDLYQKRKAEVMRKHREQLNRIAPGVYSAMLELRRLALARRALSAEPNGLTEAEKLRFVDLLRCEDRPLVSKRGAGKGSGK